MEKTEVQHQNHLDGAVNILSQDLVEEASRAGLDNHLQRWIEDLKAVSNPQLHQLIVDLQELKAHFGSGTYDKDTISRLLSRLGKSTSQAAVFAEGNTQTRVEKLGEALTAAAKQVQDSDKSTPASDLEADSASSK
ncbi:hypothetical protein [Hymenobacter sp. PAMC 26628]|uniref:hypothetical protein n=1 Tax=Hymenobacter sp. PAMC 26628 TaxID=1484118 RepID=UPI00076FE776|nr:hypothetical protein [Hymenobacter sp. PAMC 26628]AMJ66848.1 hypothetical protein AXW84_16495 [Hymenobacter sp. PAMC 26628]